MTALQMINASRFEFDIWRYLIEEVNCRNKFGRLLPCEVWNLTYGLEDLSLSELQRTN